MITQFVIFVDINKMHAKIIYFDWLLEQKKVKNSQI